MLSTFHEPSSPRVVGLLAVALLALESAQAGPPMTTEVRKLELGSFSTLVWHPDGKMLALQTDRYEEATPELPANFDGRVKISFVKLVDAETGKVTAISHDISLGLMRLKGFTADGKHLLVYRFDVPRRAPSVEWWEIEKFNTTRALALEPLSSTVVVSPDGKAVACALGHREGKRPVWQAVVWDVAAGKKLFTIDGLLVEPALAFSPDSKLLAASVIDGKRTDVELWDWAARKLERTMAPAALTGPLRLAFSPDGKTLLGAHRAPLKRWDVARGELLPKVEGNTKGTIWAQASADGRLLLCAGPGPKEGWEVRVLDAKTGAVLHTHEKTTLDCDFVPKQDAWAVHSDKGDVAIWRLKLEAK